MRTKSVIALILTIFLTTSISANAFASNMNFDTVNKETTNYDMTDDVNDYSELMAVNSISADTSWYDKTQTEFVLSDYQQLYGIAELVNSGETFKDKTIKLANNIECVDSFPRIGVTNKFDGIFDGCNYEISNVFFSTKLTKQIAAMFVSTSENAEIKNFTVSGVLEGKKCGIVGNNSGKISNVISKLRITANGFVGGICNENIGTIENCSFYGTIDNSLKYDLSQNNYNPVVGGICATNAAKATITDCKNYGNITGRGKISGICASNSGIIQDCNNYGLITCDGIYAGGISAYNSGTISDCSNLGNVNNSDKNTAGIAGYSLGNISNCINRGDASGQMYVGGIVGQQNAAATISSSKNCGKITATSHSVGGICGYNPYKDLVIDSCINIGDIISYSDNDPLAAESNNGNAGGIVGYSTKNIGIKKCINYGSVCAEKSNCGGIAGKITNSSANITNCLSIGNCACNTLENGAERPCSNLAANNYGNIYYSLGIGLPGKVCALKLSASKLTGSIAFTDDNAIELTNGAALASLENSDCSWKQGEKYPYISEFGDNQALICDEQGLRDALQAEKDIVLGAAINLEGELNIDKDAEINANGYEISGTVSALSGNLTIKNAVLQNLDIKGADVTLKDVIMKNTISLINGTLNSKDVILYDAKNIPIVSTSSENCVADLENYYLVGNDYYVTNQNSVWSENTAVSVVIPSTGNVGIPYDLKPYFSEDTCYFMLPHSADEQSIKYDVKNSAGETLAQYNTDTDKTVTVKGVEYTISILKDNIPTMYLNMDEQKGLINDMNMSYTHDSYCYGGFDLEVPEDLATAKGWETSYTDSKIEMRGRGNNTWRSSITGGVMAPYQIKLSKKQSLLGLSKGKSWTLLCAQLANKYMFNALSYGLAADIGVKYQPRGEGVNVFLNGEYIGLYTLADKIQIGSNRIDITDMEESIDAAIAAGDTNLETVDKTGGYLIEVDNNIDTIQFPNGQGQNLTIKSPENLDTVKPGTAGSKYEYITELMTDFFAAVYGDGYMTKGENAGKHFTEIVDMDSLITYLWSAELASVNDFSIGSTFIYKDIDSVNSKLRFGPLWDCDTAFNSNYSNAWMLPNRTDYFGNKIFVNALLDHKEIASYMVEYYKNNYHDLKGAFLKCGDKAIELNKYCQNSMNMSNIIYNYASANPLVQITTHVNAKSKWMEKNIDTLVTQAEKGSVITDIPNPDGDEPIIIPETVQSNDLITGFNFTDGVDSQDFPGDPSDGYESNIGQSSKLFASSTGTDLSKMIWSKAEYGDSKTDIVPILAPQGTETIVPWGEHPYFMIKTSTLGFTDVIFSAKLGGSKKGAANFNLEYSLDGENFKVISIGDKIPKNKLLTDVFSKVKMPDEVSNKETVYFRIIARDGIKISGSSDTDLFPGTTGGEIAVNNIMIYGDNGIKVNATRNNGKLNYKISNTTGKDMGTVCIYIATYNTNGTLAGVVKENVVLDKDAIKNGEVTLPNGDTVKIFLWNENGRPIKAATTVQ